MVNPARLDIPRGDTELVFTAGTRKLKSVLAPGLALWKALYFWILFSKTLPRQTISQGYLTATCLVQTPPFAPLHHFLPSFYTHVPNYHCVGICDCPWTFLLKIHIPHCPVVSAFNSCFLFAALWRVEIRVWTRVSTFQNFDRNDTVLQYS